MNDLTVTPYNRQSDGYSDTASLTVELAKALALVAPVTMTSEQQELWLRAAVDALSDIRPNEIEAVSLEMRRTVTRPSQIVPEVSKLVAERRADQSRMRQYDRPKLEGPPPKPHIADRDRRDFTAADWAELNEYLEKMGSPVRYGPDGTKLAA